MPKLKVITVVGTRPEIIRLSRVIPEMDKYFDHKLIHTGQNFDYELNEIFFKQLKLRKPDIFLESAGSSSAETIGNVISKIDKTILQLKPNALLILGDTNSCMSAIAAKRRKVPIFHMEAGNRCFDERVPEEIIRKIIDHTADINLPYSDIARNFLIAEGIPPERIIKTGSPMKEILDFYSEEIISSSIIEKLDLTEYKYFLVSAHREENVDSENNLKKLIKTLNSIYEIYKLPIIVSTHPRTRKMLEKIDIETSKNTDIKFMKPFGFLDYIKLQLKSYCVLSDSGTITEESSILNFPALNLREAHERPEGFEETSVMMVGLNPMRILSALEILKDQKRGDERDLQLVKDYDIGNLSKKIVRIIESYTDYVNRVVWKKY
tara:strand:- start:165 stop:1301 length:1137 start_codon:yes stop_codon:yes gene_type:complete